MAVELTTRLHLEDVGHINTERAAEIFEGALRQALAEEQMPGITAYFVKPVLLRESLEVGLRFEDIVDDEIESLASDVLDRAIALSRESHVSDMRRTSSMLVGA